MSLIGNTIICLWLGIGTLNAETFYKTGFESSNEDFGSFKTGMVNNQNGWKGSGNIIKDVFHSGSQSFTPGAGNGKYGIVCVRSFEEPVKTETIWVDFWMQPASDGMYGGFLQLKGTDANTSEKINFVNLFIKQNLIQAQSYNVKNGIKKVETIKISNESGAWLRLTLSIHYKTHSYDLYLNGELKKSGIDFNMREGVGYAENLHEIYLGGGCDKKSLAHYDDLYIGDSSPLN